MATAVARQKVHEELGSRLQLASNSPELLFAMTTFHNFYNRTYERCVGSSENPDRHELVDVPPVVFVILRSLGFCAFEDSNGNEHTMRDSHGHPICWPWSSYESKLKKHEEKRNKHEGKVEELIIAQKRRQCNAEGKAKYNATFASCIRSVNTTTHELVAESQPVAQSQSTTHGQQVHQNPSTPEHNNTDRKIETNAPDDEWRKIREALRKNREERTRLVQEFSKLHKITPENTARDEWIKIRENRDERIRLVQEFSKLHKITPKKTARTVQLSAHPPTGTISHTPTSASEPVTLPPVPAPPTQSSSPGSSSD
jgi:hypothetical protein